MCVCFIFKEINDPPPSNKLGVKKEKSEESKGDKQRGKMKKNNSLKLVLTKYFLASFLFQE